MTDDPKCCGNCRFHGEVPYGQGGITCQRHAPAAAGPRLELFARPWTPLFPKRDGWDHWGNEMDSDVKLIA